MPAQLRSSESKRQVWYDYCSEWAQLTLHSEHRHKYLEIAFLTAGTLTLCLRAWFLLLKNKISFFLMTWLLKNINTNYCGIWQKLYKTAWQIKKKGNVLVDTSYFNREYPVRTKLARKHICKLVGWSLIYFPTPPPKNHEHIIVCLPCCIYQILGNVELWAENCESWPWDCGLYSRFTQRCCLCLDNRLNQMGCSQYTLIRVLS